MDDSTTTLTPEQARAARALVQVSPDYIAAEAGLDRSAVRGFEYGQHGLDPDERTRLRRALEELGAHFIAEDDDGGVGVRLRFNSSKVRSLERWEGEGGPAYEDDV